ncbi:hypothetical protein BDB00DRAFT_880549 [Zychaea mexicana]|uniref:uncharacterized protein n=1 Tax=Zychaea mexicana TaxID=64656 RepID=UPI0022FF3FF0|nr:uncharacterized protein BDB00DRAFT_880549 [Zychaea mexicana]KAI9467498.1 hypothetical protein BDB00DRAFT_880549 [Zychaea mexicana]
MSTMSTTTTNKQAWQNFRGVQQHLVQAAKEAQGKRAYFDLVKAQKAHTWTGAYQPRPKPGQAFHHCRKHQYGWNKSRPIDCRFATLDESTGAIRFDGDAAIAERDRVHDAYVQLSAAYAWDKDGVSWPDVIRMSFLCSI